MGAVELIEQAERNLLYANKALKSIKEMERLKYGGFVICDDGCDRWLAEEDDWEEALEEAVESVLKGKYENFDEREMEGEAYNCFCNDCPALFSRIGCGRYNHKQSKLIELLSEKMEDHELKEVVEYLGLEEEDEDDE